MPSPTVTWSTLSTATLRTVQTGINTCWNMLQMRGYSCGTYSGDDNDNRNGATNQSIDGNKNAMETLANIASVVNKTEAHFDPKDLSIIGSILNPEQIDHNNATKAKPRKSIGRCRLIEIEARFDIYLSKPMMHEIDWCCYMHRNTLFQNRNKEVLRVPLEINGFNSVHWKQIRDNLP